MKTRALLAQNIRQYYDCRKVYIPGLASIDHGEDGDKLESQPEILKLWVPSQIPAENRSTWCLPGIPDLEVHFRYAQADDMLADLRRHIRLLQLARDQNAKHTKSTSSKTRSQGILDGFRGKIKRLASQYKDARQALLALDPAQKLAPNWAQYLLPLNDRDLRPPMRDEAQPSEGQTQYSWIWTTSYPPPLSSTSTTTSGDSQPVAPPPVLLLPKTTSPAVIKTLDQDSQDFERVQWAKCQARAERYEEEVQLTVEEMGRTLRYFEWKRDWWLSLIPDHKTSDYPSDIQGGLRAYACRQSHLYNELVTLFVVHWRTYLSARSLGSTWLDDYDSRVDTTPTRPARGHRKADVSSDPVTINTPVSSSLPATPGPLMDAPLDSESNNDSEGDDNVDSEGDVEDPIDAEDMFDDD